MTAPRRRVFLYLTRGVALLVPRHVDFPGLAPEVPGGTIEPGERPEAAALREAREETGLDALGVPELLGRRRVVAGRGRRGGGAVRAIVGAARRVARVARRRPTAARRAGRANGRHRGPHAVSADTALSVGPASPIIDAMTTLSVLDLTFVPEGATPGDALRASLDVARHAERLGYRRFWVAEHHNMIGVASAATSVVVGYLAAGTERIRVGAGGIMLPNHSPLQVAEQFGTLESLYPGRIDLGLGRAPGTDQLTARAMRRDLAAAAERFPEDVAELRALFDDARSGQPIVAVPGAGLRVPLWMLGSSLYGAQLAAGLGLPYAFASHFAPAALDRALAVYRERFVPSARLAAPYAVPCVNVVVADSDAEARHLFTTLQQMFVGMVRGRRGLMPGPIDDIETYWSPLEKRQVSEMLSCAFVGSPETVRAALARFVERTDADELMIATPVFDHAARLRSMELLAAIGATLDEVVTAATAGGPEAVRA